MLSIYQQKGHLHLAEVYGRLGARKHARQPEWNGQPPPPAAAPPSPKVFAAGHFSNIIFTNSSLSMLPSVPNSLTISLTTSVAEGQCCSMTFFNSSSLTLPSSFASVDSKAFLRLSTCSSESESVMMQGLETPAKGSELE